MFWLQTAILLSLCSVSRGGQEKTQASPCRADCSGMYHFVWIAVIDRQFLHWQMGRDGAQHIKRLYRSLFYHLFDHRYRGSSV